MTAKKLTPKKLSYCLAAAIVALACLIFISITLFLYKNFYQTITQSKEIMILREKVALDMVDMEKFDVIMNKLTKKTVRLLPPQTPSPFR